MSAHFTCARRVVAALAFALATSVGSAAVADEATAEQFFQLGLNAMKKNDYPVACDAFSQSNKADPSPGTQINLAVCFEKQNKWASAWTWYRSAFGLAQQRGQKEREQLADDSANRLQTKLHYVVVSIKEPLTDLEVKRDGTLVATTAGGKDVPLPIDPGEHTIEVSAKTKKPWKTALKVADNALTDHVDVPKLEDAPADLIASRDTPKAGAGGGGATGNEGNSQRTVGIVVGAAGILSALACGGVFILASSEASSRDTQSEAFTKAAEKDKPGIQNSINSHSSAAKNDQLIGLILGGGAVVLLGVGAFLYFTAPKPTAEKTAVRVSPLISPTFAGLGLGGGF